MNYMSRFPEILCFMFFLNLLFCNETSGYQQQLVFEWRVNRRSENLSILGISEVNISYVSPRHIYTCLNPWFMVTQQLVKAGVWSQVFPVLGPALLSINSLFRGHQPRLNVKLLSVKVVSLQSKPSCFLCDVAQVTWYSVQYWGATEINAMTSLDAIFRQRRLLGLTDVCATCVLLISPQ